MKRKGNILIAEDETLFAMVLKKIITTLGYDICAIVTSGEDAVKKAGDESPDAVFMDITLKGKMNGIAAAKAICSVSEIPIIFMSGYPAEEIRKQAGPLKPVAILTKPVSKKDIEKVLHLVFC